MKLGILPAIGLVGLVVVTDLRICEINKRLDALEKPNYVTAVEYYPKRWYLHFKKTTNMDSYYEINENDYSSQIITNRP